MTLVHFSFGSPITPTNAPSGKRGPEIDWCTYTQLTFKENLKFAKNANGILALVFGESKSNVKDKLNLNLFLDTDMATKNKLKALTLGVDTDTPPKQELRPTWSPPNSS